MFIFFFFSFITWYKFNLFYAIIQNTNIHMYEYVYVFVYAALGHTL